MPSRVKSIRRNVFKATQAEFAKIAGVAQSSVSRWESGVSPTIDEISVVRSAAIKGGLGWSDTWVFDEPVTARKLAIAKWMSGLPLDQRERAIVDEALADNKAAQLLRCYEGAAS